MRRVALAAALCGCTPPADTVGAWTTGETSSASQESSSTDGVAVESSSTASFGSSSSSSSSSAAGSSSSSSSTGTAAPPPWVATIAAGSPPLLRVVDLDGGMVVDVCELGEVVEPDALAFLPDDRLVGAHAPSSALWIADPCDCTVTMVPPLDLPLALHAMAERDDLEPTIVGVDAGRMGMFEVALAAAAVAPVADLVNAGAIRALAAAPGTDELHAIADGPRLQRIDTTGVITNDLALEIPASATGLTIEPQSDMLLACDDEGTLWRIDPTDGASEALAVALPAGCRTLATPHATIACIDAAFGG